MKLLPLFLCAVAMLLGCAALWSWGTSPPAWLKGLEAALLAVAALLYGYFRYLPRIPGWLLARPVRGAALFCAGVAVMYVPPQLVLSAFLIGNGVRMVWEAACEPGPMTRRGGLAVRETNGAIHKP